MVDDLGSTRVESFNDSDDATLSASELFALELRGISKEELNHEAFVAAKR